MSRWRRLMLPLSIAAVAATLGVAPILAHGNVWGHDFDYHLPAWIDAAHQLHSGILYPEWTAEANNGFGGPLFVFYPPVSWMTGGLLTLALPWMMVPGALVWLTLFLSGLAMWVCAREWLEPQAAAMAAAFYALNPYAMCNIYKRCAYPELMADAALPLLVWGGLRLSARPRAALLSLAAAVAALWLSDLPAAVIGTYTLGVIVAVGALRKRSLTPLAWGGLTLGTGLGLAAFFLVPAVWEQRWVSISDAVRPDLAPENNFLFARHNIEKISFNHAVSFLATAVALTAGVAVWWLTKGRRAPKIWKEFAVLGAIAMALMAPISSYAYRFLPELRFIQFPWRWFAVLCVAAAFLAAAAPASRAQRRIVWAVGLGLLALLDLGVVHGAPFTKTHMQELADRARAGEGFGHNGSSNFTNPKGSDPFQLPNDAPRLAVSPDQPGTEVLETRWTAEEKAFTANLTQPATVAVKLLNYPAWTIRRDGQTIMAESKPGSGQMLVPASAGSHSYDVVWTRTADRSAGIAVSLATMIALGLGLAWRRAHALPEPQAAPRRGRG